MCSNAFVYIHFILNSFFLKSKSGYRICLDGNAFNANEEMFACNADADVSYPDTEHVYLSIK